MRCEGWTRHGGVFTFGPVTWTQCPNEAVVMLKVEQKVEGQSGVSEQPACIDCWKEAKAWPITILSATPIEANVEAVS